MSYTPLAGQPFAAPPPPQQQLEAPGLYNTPPPPPPKPGSASPTKGPPLPPPPPGQHPLEPSELDAGPSQAAPGHGPQQSFIEPNWLPETLKAKATADLHALLDDPALQAALLTNPRTTHPSVLASTRALAPHLETNTALATAVSQLESAVDQKRAATQARLLALRALEQQHRAKMGETEAALREFGPRALYQRLSAGVHEQQALLRGIEESWLEEGAGVASEREVAEWVRRVREASRVEFLRRERRERWDEGRVGGWR